MKYIINPTLKMLWVLSQIVAFGLTAIVVTAGYMIWNLKLKGCPVFNNAFWEVGIPIHGPYSFDWYIYDTFWDMLTGNRRPIPDPNEELIDFKILNHK